MSPIGGEMCLRLNLSGVLLSLVRAKLECEEFVWRLDMANSATVENQKCTRFG